MKAVLLVTSDESLRPRLERALPGSSVLTAQSDAEALRTLCLMDVDAVLRDSAPPATDPAAFVAKVREILPRTPIVALGTTDTEAEGVDFTLPTAFTRRDLDNVIRHIVDKRRLAHEIETLRAQLAQTPSVEPLMPHEGPALTRILKDFSRLFAAGFDLPRVLEMFLDAIGELLRPTRGALLLPDADGHVYRVRAHRGLAAQIAESLRLTATDGLARWLARQGRPARLQDLTDSRAARELTLLQGVLAVPLLTRGELVAVLILGQPVIGGTYGRHETEILFDLASHLATAIRDITLHHRLQREKEFNERILAHMSSGVVTIGHDERVGIFNRRAEEILGLAARDAVGQDLRILPSPLGDMLFETLSHGRAIPKSEIRLALRGLSLEVSTCPIRGDESAPLGAALVFEDLTAQKELAAQKRQAEEFQLLARVVARIADEIKNPLVSINTFVELIEERYEDPDFRKSFSPVVRRDVRRLVQVFEKLAGLVSEGELNFSTVDVHTVIDDVVTTIERSEDGPGWRPLLEVAREGALQPVKVDSAQLKKALSYLVWYLAHHSGASPAKVTISAGRHTERDGAERVRIFIGSRTASVPADKLLRLFDPVHMVQEGLIDVGPAVSQRLVEALGGHLMLREGRHELGFLVSLPLAGS